MKRNSLYLYIIACIFFGVSCTDEMLKANYDYKMDASKLPTSELTVTEITGASVSCIASMSFVDENKEYIEKGFVCAKDVDFTEGVISTPVKSKIFSGTLIGLDELTDYFVKAYIITNDGTSYSDFQIITTPVFVNPLLYLCGTYVESDYLYEDGLLDGNYYVKLSPIKANPIQLKMTNFWGGGEEIVVDVDLVTKKLTIALQTIYVDETYGNVQAFPFVKQEVDKSGSPVVGTIGANGIITFNAWAASVSEGNFGVYSKSTLEPAVNLLIGTYTETDYIFPADTIEASYADAVKIGALAGDLNKITIKNFWNKGLTYEIFATVDFDKMELTIPSQTVYNHPTFGDYKIKPFDLITSEVATDSLKCDLSDDGSILFGAWTATGSQNIYSIYTKSILKNSTQLSVNPLLSKSKIKSLH